MLNEQSERFRPFCIGHLFYQHVISPHSSPRYVHYTLVYVRYQVVLYITRTSSLDRATLWPSSAVFPAFVRALFTMCSTAISQNVSKFASRCVFARSNKTKEGHHALQHCVPALFRTQLPIAPILPKKGTLNAIMNTAACSSVEKSHLSQLFSSTVGWSPKLIVQVRYSWMRVNLPGILAGSSLYSPHPNLLPGIF